MPLHRKWKNPLSSKENPIWKMELSLHCGKQVPLPKIVSLAKKNQMNHRRMIPCMGMFRNRGKRKPQPVKPPAPIRKQTPRRTRNDELLRSKAAMSKRASNGSRNLPEGYVVSIEIKNNSARLPIPPAKRNRQDKQHNTHTE